MFCLDVLLGLNVESLRDEAGGKKKHGILVEGVISIAIRTATVILFGIGPGTSVLVLRKSCKGTY